MSQQPETVAHWKAEAQAAQEHIEILRAQVERLQAAGQVVAWFRTDEHEAPALTNLLVAAEFDGPGDWRVKAGYRHEDGGSGWCVWGASWTPTRWAHMPADPDTTPAHSSTPAQEAADTGADVLEALTTAERALCLPCDRWNKTQALIVNEALAKVRAALAERSGQGAASAMVPISEHEAGRLAGEHWLHPLRFIRAVEAHHGIGLTVGGIQASGGAE